MLDATHPSPAYSDEVALASAAPAASAPRGVAPAAPRATPLPLRNDTILGVCEAIGEDFPVNANLLRVAFAVGLFFSPVGTVAAYLGLGIVVAASRLLFPRRVAVRPAQPEQSSKPAEEQPQLPLAA